MLKNIFPKRSTTSIKLTSYESEEKDRYAGNNIRRVVKEANEVMASESISNVDKNQFYFEMKRVQNMNLEAKYVQKLML